MMRIGDRSKTSSIRVPFPEPLSTIRPHPSARCRPLSPVCFVLDSARERPNRSVTSDGDITWNLGLQHPLCQERRYKGNQNFSSFCDSCAISPSANYRPSPLSSGPERLNLLMVVPLPSWDFDL